MGQNLTIRRGESFYFTMYWMCEPLRFIPIQKVNDTLPLIITAANHGILTGTPVTLIKGSSITQEVIAENICAVQVDANTVQLDTDELGLKALRKADYLRTYTYVDLSGMKARCYFKKAIGEPILFEATTENGRLNVDAFNNLITFSISAKDTEKLSFDSAKYDLEVVQQNYVVRLIEGDVTVEGEITVDG